MKTLRIQDVIGPIMIGPSSSHTAGALRIASMANALLDGKPTEVTFTLYGSFAHTYHGHGTDKALVAGILGLKADDSRIRDSFELAKEEGLSFTFIPNDQKQTEHPNTVDISCKDDTGSNIEVRGVSIGGGAAEIVSLNGVKVHLTGEYHSIIIKQKDSRGVLAHIANCLAIYHINIASTHLYREGKGDIAYTILETDDKPDANVLNAISQSPDIISTKAIKSSQAPKDGEATMLPIEQIQQALKEFEQLDFSSGSDLLTYCKQNDCTISTAILRREDAFIRSLGESHNPTAQYLALVLEVMRTSVQGPLDNPQPSMGGLIGGEAQKLNEQFQSQALVGDFLSRAVTYSMAVLETNATMGRIVAAPTAGSSGVLPGLLLAYQDATGCDNKTIHAALANAAAVGYLISRNATVSGAEGGCQAEVGAASAMAASAAVELMGGTPAQCLAAASNALTGLMGLVCDPIAGLVEAPCQKRNATGVANAVVSAQIAMAGIGNLVDFDQTVEAMYRVGKSLPFELRESALGGLAATPAACAFCNGCN